jgi:acyl phosphate:glycerol-3-phosphate acyltransferase
MNQTLLTVPVLTAAYLVGSVSSTWIIVRLLGRYDMRHEPDGTISAAAVYHRLGFAPYALTVLGDIALGATAVVLARLVTGSLPVAMLAGLGAMAGHNWSVFLRFKGGQGATAMAGAIIAVMPILLLYGVVVALITQFFTRRSGVGTVAGVLTISAAALIRDGIGLTAFYPLGLLSLMFIKRLQLAHSAERRAISSAK